MAKMRQTTAQMAAPSASENGTTIIMMLRRQLTHSEMQLAADGMVQLLANNHQITPTQTRGLPDDRMYNMHGVNSSNSQCKTIRSDGHQHAVWRYQTISASTLLLSELMP